MEYNKTQFRKANDKKVLHKVKKQWVVLSMAMLALLGGGAVAKKASAHADTANGQNHPTAVKQQLNQNLSQLHRSAASQQNSKANVAQTQTSVSQQASILHDRILQNADLSQRNVASPAHANHQPQQPKQPNVNVPTMTAPQTNVGGTNQTVTSVPVTVKYIDNDNNHEVQRTQSDNLHVDTSQTASLDGSGHLDGYNAPANYSIANVGALGNLSYVDKNNVWEWTGSQKDQSDGSDKADPSYNWDSSNNRPLILLQPTSGSQAPIVVNYVNGSGQTLNGRNNWGSDKSDDSVNYNGHNYYGDYINVTDPNYGGVQLPVMGGGKVAVSQNDNFSDSKDYYLDSSDTDNVYQVNGTPKDVTIPLHGKTFTDGINNDSGKNAITVKLYAKNQAGQYLDKSGNVASANTPYTTFTHYLGGTIGQVTRVNANSSWLQKANNLANPGDYTVSDNVTHPIMFNPDPSDNNNGIAVLSDQNVNNKMSNNTLSYTFVENDKSAKSPTIQIEYMDGGQQVGSTQTINSTTGKVGDVINLSDTNASDNDGVAGEAVPSGYQVAPNFSTRYIIKKASKQNSPETDTVKIPVIGKQEATNHGTNYGLTINLVAQKLHSNGTADISNGENGTSTNTITPGKNSDASIAIIGRVGGSDQTVSASSFIKEVENKFKTQSGDTIDPYSDISDHTRTNDSLKFTPNGLSLNDGSATSNGQLTFHYQIHEGANNSSNKESHVYVHYVTPSDPNSDITTLYKSDGTPITNHETTVSDEGKNGTSFDPNNQTVEESDTHTPDGKRGNVPEGYQFVKVLGDNPNYTPTSKDGHTLSYHFGGWNDSPNGQPVKQYGPSDQNEVIEVVPKVRSVKINYVDQNQSVNGGKGAIIKSVVIGGNYTSKGNQKNSANGRNVSRYGSVIDPSKSNDQETTAGEVEDYAFNNNDNQSPNRAPDDDISRLGVPSDYHITSESTQYHFHPGTKQDTYDVMVAGNFEQDQDTATINVHEENKSGGTVVKSYQVADKVNGDVGDNYTINASDFTPNGYKPDTSNNGDKPLTGTIGQGSLSNPIANFYYQPTSGDDTKNLGPINISYVDDRTGTQVGSNSINPPSGASSNSPVDVRNLSGYQVPNNYQLDPGDNFITNFKGNGVTDYVTLDVHSTKPDANGTYEDNFTIIQKLYNSTGNQLNDVRTKTLELTGKNGNSDRIKQSNYPITGYSDANVNGTPSSADVKFGPSSINPTSVVFSYKAQNSSSSKAAAKPITVCYYYKGSRIGSPERVDGDMGQTFSDITKKAAVPGGYELLPGQRLSYTIGTTPQTANLNLDKNISNPRPATFHLKFASDGGTNNIQNSDNFSVYDDNVPYNLIPAAFAPQGYTPDINEDKSTGLGLNSTGDLQLSDNNNQFDVNGASHGQASGQKFSDTFYYTKDRTTAAGPITINYLDEDNGHPVGTYVATGNLGDPAVNASQHIPDSADYSAATDNPTSMDNIAFKEGSQNFTYLVVGKTVSALLTVDYNLISVNGNGQQSVSSGHESSTIYGKIGSDATINANTVLSGGSSDGTSWSPLSGAKGYTISTTPGSDSHTVYFNGQHSVTPSTITFNFYKGGIQNDDDVVNVEYKDHGALIGSGSIYGPTSHKISDVTDPSKGGVAVPSNYAVDSNQDLSYTFPSTHTTTPGTKVVQVHANSNQKNNGTKLTIHRIAIDKNGNRYDLADMTKSISGEVNSDVQVDPAKYTPVGQLNASFNGGTQSSYTFAHYSPDSTDAPVDIGITGTNSISPNSVTFVYRQSPYVDARPMVVRYFNQHHKLVGSGQINGSGHYGDTIDVTQSSDQNKSNYGNAISGVQIPNGYTLDNSDPNEDPTQRTKYTFNGEPRVINLNVIGKPESDKINVQINENGNVVNTVPLTIKERVGSDAVISANGQGDGGVKFMPSNYHEASDDSDAHVLAQSDNYTGSFDVTEGGYKSVNQTGTGQTVGFNYVANDTTAQPVTVVYLDQDGNQVGKSKVFTGSMNQSTGNVVDNDPVPNGYYLAGASAGDPSSNNYGGQPVTYTFGNKAQTVYLHVIGDHTNQNLQIERVMRDSDGNIVNEDTQSDKLSSLGGRSDVGDSSIISPTSGKLEPKGYHATASDLDQIVRVNSDESLTPNKIVFNYVRGQASDGTIMVHYVTSNGTQIGQTASLSGTIGSGLTYGNLKSQDPLADGYTIDADQNGSKDGSNVGTYTTIPQDVDVTVDPNPAPSDDGTKLRIYRLALSSDGKTLTNLDNGPISTLDCSGKSGKHVGDTVHVTPYDHVPAGYHVIADDHDFNARIDANGQLSPTNNVTYIYQKDYAPQQLNTITINYKCNGQILDTVTDHGSGQATRADGSTRAADSFDISPYKDDLPDDISNNYTFSSTSGNVPKDFSSDQTVVINVTQTGKSGK